MKYLDEFTIEVLKDDGKHGHFEISPLPRGFGYTIANPLRRILLSSLSGGSITAIKISGVEHEYSTLDGVSDDILRILLKLKRISIRSDATEPVKGVISVKNTTDNPIEITAGDIEIDPSVEIVNKDEVITTVNPNKSFDAELIVETGSGFEVAQIDKRQEIGMIPVDGSFSPVENVSMKVENTRVGQNTDLDKVILEVVTNGAYSPTEAMKEAIKIHIVITKRLATLGQLDFEIEKHETVIKTENTEEDYKSDVEEISIDDIDMSTRLKNSLMNSAISDLRLLEGKSQEDLLEIKGMGQKSAEELQEILVEHNIKIN